MDVTRPKKVGSHCIKCFIFRNTVRITTNKAPVVSKSTTRRDVVLQTSASSPGGMLHPRVNEIYVPNFLYPLVTCDCLVSFTQNTSTIVNEMANFTGPSPGFSSRGAKNQEGPKTRRAGLFLFQHRMYAATSGPNVKCGAPISNGGPVGLATAPELLRRPWKRKILRSWICNQTKFQDPRHFAAWRKACCG